MSTTQSIPPVSATTHRAAVRRGIMLAIAVCLLFHFLWFSGYFGFVERLFPSGNVFFVVGVLLETLAVFVILYRTPLLLFQTPGRSARVGRVVGLVVLAHVFVFGVMMAVAVLWFAACAVLGIPARGDV